MDPTQLVQYHRAVSPGKWWYRETLYWGYLGFCRHERDVYDTLGVYQMQVDNPSLRRF